MRRIEIVELTEKGWSEWEEVDRQPFTVFPPEAVKAASSAIRNLRWEDTTSEAMAEAALAAALEALTGEPT